MERHTYNIELHWEKDRIGTISSPELSTSFQVATPPEFDNGVPNIWSPEHLFTASVVSCFMTTFLAIANYSKFDFVNFKCSGEGILEKIEGKFKMSYVNLYPKLILKDEASREKGLKLLEKSEAACLISNSITAKVILEPKISIEN